MKDYRVILHAFSNLLRVIFYTQLRVLRAYDACKRCQVHVLYARVMLLSMRADNFVVQQPGTFSLEIKLVILFTDF